MADSTRSVLNDRLAQRKRLLVVFMLLISFVSFGCATSRNKWVALRATPRNPLSETLGLLTRSGPKPTERTKQLLRRYNLEEEASSDRSNLLAKLNEMDLQEPNRLNAYAMAELAYVGAKRQEQSRHIDQALELYGSAVVHAYRYLFDDRYARKSNPYDPEFRGACDLYNAALEGMLRIVQQQGKLLPGTSQVIQTANHDCRLEIQLKSKCWHEDDFHGFQFVVHKLSHLRL